MRNAMPPILNSEVSSSATCQAVTQISLRCSDLSQRKGAIALACEPGQRIHYGWRDHRHRRFAATGRFFGAGHDVDLGDDRRVLHVRWRVAIPVTLLHASIL